MQEKELKVSNFNGKEYIENCLSRLEEPNLPVMERRRLEAYVKNYQIRSASTTEEKQKMIEPTIFQIEKSKKKEKKHASNIKCKVGLAILITTVAAGGVSLKLQHDKEQKRIQLSNNYPKTFSQITIQKYIENNNGIAEVLKADLTKREEAKKLIQFTIEKFKNIDVLINNAGVSLIKLFTDYTDEDWNRIINNNLYSAFCTTQEVVKFMINRKQGCIIIFY